MSINQPAPLIGDPPPQPTIASIDSNIGSSSTDDYIKYGDGDVTSKKRKSDEYNTLYTKRLSSANEDIDENDYCGGLLSMAPSVAPEDPSNSGDDNDVNSVLISKQPSSSSFGFENTFKVLEAQMRGSRQLSRGEARQLLLQSTDLQRNRLLLGHPAALASRDLFLRAISEESNSANQPEEEAEVEAEEEAKLVRIDCDETDDVALREMEPPSLLELELDARKRIWEIGKSAKPTQPKLVVQNDEVLDSRNASMSEFLSGISKSSSPQPMPPPSSDSGKLESGEYPEYVYHMAKGKDGRVYLRVVRSLLVDKGTKRTFLILFESFQSFRSFLSNKFTTKSRLLFFERNGFLF